MSKPKTYTWVVIGIFLTILIAVTIFAFEKSSPTTLADQGNGGTQASTSIQKTFSFPVNNAEGQQVTSIGYAILSANKQNQVIIKGQKAYAVSGRTFLIINLKLTNSSSQTIQLNSKDYIRLSIGNSKELLAADLHNDPIVVQPISTEYTKLGFPVNVDENHFVLHVGQLNGPKTDIPLNFK